ncbi:MAG: S26 family signal peptidase [Candidatus Staskawiczbacteria bacterium]|nr:S26 family signal peptidase [Candidatus Staskawiczbacteria bacterium]
MISNKRIVVYFFVLLIAVWFFKITINDGNSMAPTLFSGQVCLVVKCVEPLPGDIVYAYDNEGVGVCKRLAWYTKNGEMFLIGDNAKNSLDSRHLGPVPMSAYIGKVAFCP